MAAATILGTGLIAMPALAQKPATQIDIAAMQPGFTPSGFTFARTGSGADPAWQVVADPSATGQKAIAQTSTDTTDYRFPLAVYQGVTATNVDVVLRFRPVAGRIDQAGGIAIRLADPDNYYVLRANALEDNVNFYRVVKGRRSQIKGYDTKVATNQWHALGLRAEGDQFVVSFDGKALFTARDATLADAGRVAAVDQGRQRDAFRRDLNHPARLRGGEAIADAMNSRGGRLADIGRPTKCR